MKLGTENNLLENTYKSGSLIAKVYFRWKVMTAIKLAGLTKEDIILDYGCGDGWLEHILKNYNIKGYDLNPKKTFVKDYKAVKPTKIFVLDVFEHIPVKVIREIIKEFKKMGKFELIVSQPTENWLSRKVRKMLGKKEVPEEHITRYREIVEVLDKEFRLVKRVNFFMVCHIFLMKN
jgi:SAM-dependent methyltransferase